MKVLNLSGIEVNFPFEPYDCQINYMSSVIDCLINKKNAILESPTGTGKTLCLLCSSLSWLLAAKADIQFSSVQNELESSDKTIDFNLKNINKSGMNSVDQNGMRSAYPKIIYASRTHSQLSQVVKELKMSQYNTIKTCVIGSRDQLCINPQVNMQKNYTVKLNMCKAKVNAKTCYFYNNVEHNAHELKTMNTVDIEDLVKFGNKFKCCPYYVARNLKDTADILFMPYNYLLDKKLRKSNNIDIKNTVIIFDEAHNVERICEDSASCEITSTDIASAMGEITFLLDMMKQNLDSEQGFSAFSDSNIDSHTDNPNSESMPATLEELAQIKIALKYLEDELDSIKVNEQQGLTKSASFIFELLTKCELNIQNKNAIFEIIQRLLQYFGAQVTNPRHHNGASLAKIFDFLQIVFSDRSVATTNMLTTKDKLIKQTEVYKVHIKYDNTKTKTLCYWCFSPSQIMQELLDEGARSIILTSGTLSPIGSLKTELRIPFDVVLENPHIIKPNQIKVLTLSKGPNNIMLKSSYENRSSEKYMETLGQLIYFASKIIPHGVLVFFPSYYVLEQTIEYWRRSNLWQKIGDVKSIFVESKGAKECTDTINKYYERINDHRGTGAIMFAVCRGKMSEGIDFSNNYGRAVIITGLPYPPFKDPRVVLKQQYLDEIRLANLSGKEWYSQQAFRAVNQAVGRVIRHKDDYGAILLCDERFSYDNSVKLMPTWLKPYVKRLNQFEPAIDELKKFFNVVIDIMPKIFNKNDTRNNMNSLKDKETNTKATNAANQASENLKNMVDNYKMIKNEELTNTAPCASRNIETTLLTALENIPSETNAPKRYDSSVIRASVKTETSNFQELLQKRKDEESKMIKPKCKVIIKDTVTIAEANPTKLNDSRNLLDKITKALTTEENRQFKLAMSCFHNCKKNLDEEGQHKNYLVLKTLFEKREENKLLFKELEAFIRYKPANMTENSQKNRINLKRKHSENENE